MKKNNKFLNDIVPSNSKAMSIPEGEFKKSLARIGYTPNDFDNFVMVCYILIQQFNLLIIQFYLSIEFHNCGYFASECR